MNKLFIKSNFSVRDALKKLSKVGEKCLIVIDKNQKYLGTLSDGDLRKFILKGNNLDKNIEAIYNKKSTYFFENNYSDQDIKNSFLKYKFDLIPIINSQMQVIKVLLWDSVFSNEKNNLNGRLNVPVVIMAGGKGTRLEPFTKVLPKPLVPIHEKPIIEHIVEKFHNIGCIDFHMTINYKGKIIKAYFEELNPKYKMNFIEEETPLGTAGSLYFLRGKIQKPFFVTNCDVIIKDNYESIYQYHIKGQYDITLVASAKEYIIPYGTCDLTKEGFLDKINEKPKYNFLVNSGMYILSPKILSLIKKNKFYHITDMIEDAKKAGKKVGVFPIDDDAWIDIGQWNEYRSAIDKL
tara:strand:+ start:417 stop:1466 length:1050 start_codon:yes stop_codon:yes gene_type:complete